MAVSYINDEFFSRLETLALNLRKDLAGFFGGKHLVKTYGQTVEFADYREYSWETISEESTGIYIAVLRSISSSSLLTSDRCTPRFISTALHLWEKWIR